MDESKYGLYIVAAVGLIAIIAMVVLTVDTTPKVNISNTDTAGKAMASFADCEKMNVNTCDTTYCKWSKTCDGGTRYCCTLQGSSE